MQYIRKKPKGFGRNAQIEGEVLDGARVLLVEDLATDGGSKVGFIEALRKSGQRCNATFVFFFYDIFPKGARNNGQARRRTALSRDLARHPRCCQSFRLLHRRDNERGRGLPRYARCDGPAAHGGVAEMVPPA